jgi:hypothetical protein
MKNQAKLPIVIPISTQDTLYIPHAPGSNPWESEITMILNLSNHAYVYEYRYYE